MIKVLKPYLVQEKKQNIYFIITLLLTFFLPLYKISSSPFLILSSIIIILEILFSKGKILSSFFKQKINIFFLIFYLLAGFSLLYSKNLNHGFNQLNKLLPLLIFPLWFLVWKATNTQIVLILKTFIFACILAFLLSLGSQFWNILTHNNYSFYYIQFIDILWMHPTYLSLYLNFAIFISYYLYTKKHLSLAQFAFCSLIFISFILMLLARMQILLMFLVLIIISIHFLKQNFSFKILFFCFISLFATLFIISQNQQLKNRFVYAKNIQYNFENLNDKNWNGVNVRLAIWKSAFSTIKENVFFGAGIGDEDDVLFESYKNNNFKFAYNLKYVAHNQYIQILLGLGVLGFIVYLFMYFLLIKNAFLNNDFLLFALIILLFFTGFTESFLRLQSGIIFFAYFICLLVYKNSLRED
ncbi:MAG: O-antigen ligase family protein [Chitinophagales bacterium]